MVRKMSFYNNNKQFLLNQILWLIISLGISITISLLLPFPVSLVTIIGVFILLNMYTRRLIMKRMSRTNATGMFGYRPSMFNSNDGSSLKYYCISCGTQHNEVSCPKCGSKMK